MSRSKGGLNTKVHVAVDAHGLPVRAVVTDATTADAQVIEKLIEDLPAGAVLADKAYDINHVVNRLAAQGILAVIPPEKPPSPANP